MATNYIQDGDVLTYSNAGSVITAGSVVAIGSLIGIALTDIAATSGSGSVQLRGVFSVPKVTGTAWTQGAKLLWDASAAKFDLGTATPATGDISGCCVAAAAAASGDTTGKVLLNVGVGTIT